MTKDELIMRLLNLVDELGSPAEADDDIKPIASLLAMITVAAMLKLDASVATILTPLFMALRTLGEAAVGNTAEQSNQHIDWPEIVVDATNSRG